MVNVLLVFALTNSYACHNAPPLLLCNSSQCAPAAHTLLTFTMLTFNVGSSQCPHTANFHNVLMLATFKMISFNATMDNHNVLVLSSWLSQSML